jgi:alkylation response protein AidB-like acyl-CoA dehydrogenase
VAGARHADAMLCLARTGDAPDQQALFLFALDLPGVAVMPQTMLDGSDHLATVTLDGVRVPADALLGAPVGAVETLNHLDRLAPPEAVLAPRLRVHLGRLQARLRTAGGADDDLAGLLRQVAELEIDVAGLEGLELRALAGEDAGAQVPALASVLRLKQAAAAQRLGELQVASLGYYALPFPDALLIDNEGPIGHHYALSELADMLRGRSWSIDGGTSEIHKNRIARTILGF